MRNSVHNFFCASLLRCAFLCVVAAAFFACNNAVAPQVQKLQGNYFTPRYAQGFCIDTVGGTKMLTVLNPFQQATGRKYVYRISDSAPTRLVCMSTTQLAFLDFIGKTDVVVGVSGARYIFNTLLQNLYQQGKIVEVGYESNLDIETVVALQPNAVLAYGINGEFEVLEKKLQELGIPVIYIGEYVETHPLGKAEWVIAMAAFWGVEQEAQAKFLSVEDQYFALKNLLSEGTPKVSVLMNAPWNDSWFFPGRESNMAQLLRDAGGESVVPLRAGRDAYPVDIETVFLLAQNAQFWLNPGNVEHLQALRQMHKLTEHLPVFAQGRVFNNNLRSTPQGGSDFFESGTVNPHLILKDLIHILHPEILPQHELFYYRKVEN